MLAYVLALVVGAGSFILYMSAFFFPEVYRRYDLVWSGVGLFYALVLWVCAGRITGGVLLGQIASVALLGWLGWQTLALRRAQTPLAQQTRLPDNANSLSDVMQKKMMQIQATLQGRSPQISLVEQLDNLPEGVTRWITALRGWLEAFLSTTIKSQQDLTLQTQINPLEEDQPGFTDPPDRDPLSPSIAPSPSMDGSPSVEQSDRPAQPIDPESAEK